jgi:hypothetical protein
MIEASPYRQVAPSGVSTFANSVRVRGGDRLGLSGGGALPVGYGSPAVNDRAATTLPCAMPPLDAQFGAGTACPLNVIGGARVNVAATLERRG